METSITFTTHKIEKIVSLCNSCSHCIIASAKNEKYFAICTFKEPFILMSNSENPKHFILSIPENCSLDNYEGDVLKYNPEDND